MAYSRDAFIRDQQETRERQDQSETSVRLERYDLWRMAYHSLTKQLERAKDQRDLEIARDQRDTQRGDMELFRQLDDRQTDRAIP